MAHYTEFISQTSYLPYTFPQHSDIPTSTAVNMPTSSTAFYIPKSSTVADIMQPRAKPLEVTAVLR